MRSEKIVGIFSTRAFFSIQFLSEVAIKLNEKNTDKNLTDMLK